MLSHEERNILHKNQLAEVICQFRFPDILIIGTNPPAQFQEMIRQDAFLEFDAHAANYYGTPLDQLEEKLTRGDVILDVEPAGAKIVKEKRPEAILIFVMPPSVEELERRLRSRGDTPEDQIALRMERAKWEMDQRSWYDHVVVNDVLENCVNEMAKIIG